MRQITLKWYYFGMVFVFLITACAGTELTQTWVDEAHRGKPVSDILVIALTYKDNEEVRRSFEDSFVRQLRAAGVDAVSSMDAISIPADMKLEKVEVLKVVNKFNNDAVIITHLVSKDEKEGYTFSGEGSGGYYGYYGWAYNYSRPGYSQTIKSVRLATKLYDVKTEKLIWSGESKSLKQDSTKQTINDVISVVIKDLQRNKLLPQE